MITQVFLRDEASVISSTKKIEALPWLKSKIGRIIKVSYTYKDHAQKNSDYFDFEIGRASCRERV